MEICASINCHEEINRRSYSRDFCTHQCWIEADTRRRNLQFALRAAKPKTYKVRRTMSDEPEPLGQPSAWRWK
jgi:hypothetical protein